MNTVNERAEAPLFVIDNPSCNKRTDEPFRRQIRGFGKKVDAFEFSVAVPESGLAFELTAFEIDFGLASIGEPECPGAGVLIGGSKLRAIAFSEPKTNSGLKTINVFAGLRIGQPKIAEHEQQNKKTKTWVEDPPLSRPHSNFLQSSKLLLILTDGAFFCAGARGHSFR